MHATVEDIPIEMSTNGILTRGATWGGIVVRHLDLPAGVDFTPLLAGLPGDVCDCPHWGQVLTGSITVKYADGREETTQAGELYYWPGGHTGWTNDGVSFIEYSPADQIAPVLEHIGKKVAASV